MIFSSFHTFMNRNCRAVRFWINSFPSARNGVIRSLMRREECSSGTRTRNWTEGGEKYRLLFHVKFRSPAEFQLGFFLSFFYITLKQKAQLQLFHMVCMNMSNIYDVGPKDITLIFHLKPHKKGLNHPLSLIRQKMAPPSAFSME